MSVRKRFPKEIFVKWDEPTEDEYYLLASETITDHADKQEKTIVGTYRLVREDVVTLVTKISQRKVRR